MGSSAGLVVLAAFFFSIAAHFVLVVVARAQAVTHFMNEHVLGELLGKSVTKDLK